MKVPGVGHGQKVKSRVVGPGGHEGPRVGTHFSVKARGLPGGMVYRIIEGCIRVMHVNKNSNFEIEKNAF